MMYWRIDKIYATVPCHGRYWAKHDPSSVCDITLGSYSMAATLRWNPLTTPAPGSHGNQRSAKKTWLVVNSGALYGAAFIIPFFSPPKTLYYRYNCYICAQLGSRDKSPFSSIVTYGFCGANLSGPVEQILYPHKF